MRCIGLVGGMSWESSALYYRLLNQAVGQALGGHHNARSVMATLDFQPLLEAAGRGDWKLIEHRVGQACAQLEAAGADFILLTANTAHHVFDALPRYTRLPALHIGVPAARALRRAGYRRAGLLGTRHVTESSFYPDWMRRYAGIELVAPPEQDRAWLDQIIFEELAHGRIEPSSRAALLDLIDRMRRDDLGAVLVACTELPLLLAAGGPAPALACFDTVALHVAGAVDVALGREELNSGVGLPES